MSLRPLALIFCSLAPPSAKRLSDTRIYAFHTRTRSSHNIVHRDLKLENIIVTDTLHVKLIDFGLATYGKASKRMRTLCGSKHTIAPEIVRGETYDKKCDCWSIGVILYCMTSGFQPFEGDNDLALWKHISLAKCYFPHFLSSELQNLLKRLLDGNPSTRASAVDALEHEWTVACEQKILKKGLEGARAPPAFRIDDARRHNMAFLETARRVHAAKIKLAPQLRGNSDLETDLDDKEDLRDILDDSPPRTPAPSRPSSPATVHSSCSDSDSPPPRRHNETRAPLHRPVPLKPKCSSRVPVKTLHSEPARRHHSRPSFFPPIRPSSADGKVAAHAARHHQLKKGSDVGNNVSARNPNGKARKLCKLMNGLAVQHGTASRSSSGSGSHDKRNSRRPPTRQRTSRPPSRLSRLRGKEKKETKLWSPAHSPVRGLSPLGNKRPASTHPTTSPRRGSSRKKRAAMAIRGSKMINSAKIAAQRVSDPMAQRQPAPSIPPKTGSCRMQAVRANGSDQTAKNAAAVRPALPRRSRLSRWKVGHAKKALIRTLTPPLPRQK